MKEIMDMLIEVSPELYTKLTALYVAVKQEFETKPSSTKYHHLEAGGMGRHVKEVMNIALEIYDAHPDWYDCKREDVILVAFVHDFNKLGKYIPSELWMQQQKYGGRMFQYDQKRLAMNETAETVSICAVYGLILQPIHINAISYHHGGFAPDLNSVTGRGGDSMSPLAVLLHAADLISGFILGNPKYEKEKKHPGP